MTSLKPPAAAALYSRLLIASLLPQAFAQPPSSSEFILNQMDAGHWKYARELVNGRLRANSNDPLSLYLESKVAASFGDLEKGLTFAQRAVSLNDGVPDYLAQLAEMQARLADRVSIVKQIIYVRQLKKEIETALALNPRHVDSMLVNIMFLAKAPVLAGGDKKRAHALAQQLVSIDPGWGHLVEARLGELEHEDGAVERALNQAILAQPSSYLARYSLAKFYCCVSRAKRYDRAEKAAREAIRLDPARSGGYEILARTYASQRRWADLDSVLLEAEQKAPADLAPYYYAADALLEGGQDFPRAGRYLHKYLGQEAEGRQPTLMQGKQLLVELAARQNSSRRAQADGL